MSLEGRLLNERPPKDREYIRAVIERHNAVCAKCRFDPKQPLRVQTAARRDLCRRMGEESMLAMMEAHIAEAEAAEKRAAA